MKKIKQLVAVMMVAVSVVFSGCGANPLSTKISPVEDSGETVSCTAVSISLPKDWKQVDGAKGNFDGITLSKGFLNNTVVLVMDVEGMDASILEDEETAAPYIDQIKGNVAAMGVTVNDAEVRTYSYGKGLYITASGEITQETIDTNIAAGLCTEAQGKALVGKNKNETLIYFFIQDKIIGIDAITLGDDADGVSEVAEFVANSLQDK